MSKQSNKKKQERCERLQKRIDNLLDGIEELEKPVSPYGKGEEIEWIDGDVDPAAQREQFYSILTSHILVTEFCEGFYALVSPADCDCGNHFNVTVLFPPDVHPMTVTLGRSEAFDLVSETFNIKHFRAVAHATIEDEAARFAREYPETSKDARKYANGTLRLFKI